jgi:hypothetical protein
MRNRPHLAPSPTMSAIKGTAMTASNKPSIMSTSQGIRRCSAGPMAGRHPSRRKTSELEKQGRQRVRQNE